MDLAAEVRFYAEYRRAEVKFGLLGWDALTARERTILLLGPTR